MFELAFMRTEATLPLTLYLKKLWRLSYGWCLEDSFMATQNVTQALTDQEIDAVSNSNVSGIAMVAELSTKLLC